ncbi:MAG: tetratricopeptide repeat protein [Halofilum sp. (in: g-proteobacteria)]|nr:tetratricopeptide repeat protein [Halofilum sp. (in: g-proteobacteria)]
MPARPADGDPAGDVIDASGELRIRGHQFPAANTAIPHLLDFPAWVNERQREFLQGSMRVDLFGIRAGGTIDGRLSAPLGADGPSLEPGRRYLLEAVVRTVGLGHLFTQGTADSNEVWVELRLTAGDRVIGTSGGVGEAGRVDPWAHFVNAYVLDRQANRIDRRNPQDIFTMLYNHQIPPGAADTLHYAFTVPEDLDGPVEAEVRLHYRKFDTTYMRHFQDAGFDGNDLPVVTLASDRVVFPVGSADARDAGAPAGDEPPAWERWNDFGIGLLRKGGKGQLRQAEAAFRAVADHGRPDGLVNLARVYLREGRVSEAAAVLRRAADHEPPGRPWVIAWLSGQVNRQRGELEAAANDYRSLVDNAYPEATARGFDFSLDYRVLNELGIVRFQQARRASGAQAEAYHDAAVHRFEQVLGIDPENRTAHYNLARIHDWRGDDERARRHWTQYARYKPDDNARDKVVAAHRRVDAPADHAAEDVVIYDLQRPGRPDDPVATLQAPHLRADVAAQAEP